MLWKFLFVLFHVIFIITLDAQSVKLGIAGSHSVNL